MRWEKVKNGHGMVAIQADSVTGIMDTCDLSLNLNLHLLDDRESRVDSECWYESEFESDLELHGYNTSSQITVNLRMKATHHRHPWLPLNVTCMSVGCESWDRWLGLYASQLRLCHAASGYRPVSWFERIFLVKNCKCQVHDWVTFMPRQMLKYARVSIYRTPMLQSLVSHYTKIRLQHVIVILSAIKTVFLHEDPTYVPLHIGGPHCVMFTNWVFLRLGSILWVFLILLPHVHVKPVHGEPVHCFVAKRVRPLHPEVSTFVVGADDVKSWSRESQRFELFMASDCCTFISASHLLSSLLQHKNDSIWYKIQLLCIAVD